MDDLCSQRIEYMKKQWLLLLATVGMMMGVMADACGDCANCFVYFSGSDNTDFSADSVSDMESYTDTGTAEEKTEATIGYCTEANLNEACNKLSDYGPDDDSPEGCGTNFKVNNLSICFDSDNGTGTGYCQSCKDCKQAKGKRTYA